MWDFRLRIRPNGQPFRTSGMLAGSRPVPTGRCRREQRVGAAGVAGADQWEGDAVKVFVFDLLPYPENLDHLKVGKELPWPLPGRHFDPEVGARAYAEHLEAWEELDRLGYDGVGFNEHHTSPYGLMNSPNLMAAAASQRTRRLKLLIYGNALPIHDPLRLAEELAMLDCMSNGRIIAGFVRASPASTGSTACPCPSPGPASRRPSRSCAACGRRRCSPTGVVSGAIRTWPSGRGRSSVPTLRSGSR